MNTAIQAIHLITDKSERLVDTRLIAENLGNQHQNTLQLLDRYIDKFKSFGKVMFKTEPLPSGQKEKYALLNEDQAYFLLSLSRNTDRVVDLKARLVLAFREARLALDLTKHEYLPTYHDLHDEIHVRAAGSENERFVHINVNRLVNKTVGIGSGKQNQALVAHRLGDGNQFVYLLVTCRFESDCCGRRGFCADSSTRREVPSIVFRYFGPLPC